MIPEIHNPPPSTTQTISSHVTTDRAVPGPDQPDRRAAGVSRFDLGEAPEQPNRRGRRFQEREVRRIRRSMSRQDRREMIEELADRAEQKKRAAHSSSYAGL